MESLTLEQVYFISQTIAAMAVVISLLYVGFQLKQNTIATQTASTQAFVAADSDVVGLINSSPNLADVLHQGANGLSELKGGDLIRFMAFHDINFITLQSFYLQWQAGTLDEALLATWKQAMIDLFHQKGQREWWEQRRHWFNQDFQNYVEEAMAAGLSKPMHPGAVKD